MQVQRAGGVGAQAEIVHARVAKHPHIGVQTLARTQAGPRAHQPRLGLKCRAQRRGIGRGHAIKILVDLLVAPGKAELGRQAPAAAHVGHVQRQGGLKHQTLAPCAAADFKHFAQRQIQPQAQAGPRAGQFYLQARAKFEQRAQVGHALARGDVIGRGRKRAAHTQVELVIGRQAHARVNAVAVYAQAFAPVNKVGENHVAVKALGRCGIGRAGQRTGKTAHFPQRQTAGLRLRAGAILAQHQRQSRQKGQLLGNREEFHKNLGSKGRTQAAFSPGWLAIGAKGRNWRVFWCFLAFFAAINQTTGRARRR